MPRVAVLVDALDVVNGVTRTYEQLAEYWGQQDWELVIYGTGGTGKTRETLRNGSASITIAVGWLKFGLPRYQNIRLSLPIVQTMRLFNRCRFDIVHIANPGPLSFHGILQAKLRGLPIVTTHHTRMGEYAAIYAPPLLGPILKFLVEAIIRWEYRSSAATLVHSQGTAKEALALGAKNVIYVPMGVPLPYPKFDDLAKKRQEARQRFFDQHSLDASQPLLIYVGRLGREKGLNILLRTAQKLNLPVVLAGDGPIKREIELNPYAKVLGTLEGQALEDMYLAADLFVSASITETLGRTFLESLAYGTPILVPDHGQHVRELPSGSRAINFFKWTETDGGEADLTQQTRQILDRKQSTALNEEALKAALSFSWEQVIPKHIEPYRQIASSRLR